MSAPVEHLFRDGVRPMTSEELVNRLVWLELEPRDDAKRLLWEERIALQEALQSGDRERIEATHASAEKVLRAMARLWGLPLSFAPDVDPE